MFTKLYEAVKILTDFYLTSNVSLYSIRYPFQIS